MPGEKYQTADRRHARPQAPWAGGIPDRRYQLQRRRSTSSPHGNNNTFVQPIYINPEPPADLVTSDVAAPDQAFDGTTITVTYQVSNLGLGATDVPSWTDTIWLTTDKTRPNTTKGDVLLATIPHTGLLGNDPTVISPPTSYDRRPPR